MLLVDYLEVVDSQRGIAWRRADSLSLRQLLGIDLDEKTATIRHSPTPARVCRRKLWQVFQFVLQIDSEKKLLAAMAGRCRQHDAGVRTDYGQTKPAKTA